MTTSGLWKCCAETDSRSPWKSLRLSHIPSLQESGQLGWLTRHFPAWRVDETYVRVKGRWCYLYRVIDFSGATIDFVLSGFAMPLRPNACSARR